MDEIKKIIESICKKMHKLFLYHLFKEAKLFFLFAILFILAYVIVLRKQMDMLLFPINSMFSMQTARDFSTSTYALKLNGKIVKITDDPYLKKDFSESSLQMFSKWIKADRKDLMTGLLERRITDTNTREKYLKKLAPLPNTINTWPVWFVKFHHLPVRVGDGVEIWEYTFDVTENTFKLRDSTLVIKQTVTNE